MSGQEHSSIQTNRQKFFEFLFLVTIILPVGFVSLFILTKLAWYSCPSGTFVAGTTRPEMQKWSWVVALVALFFLAEYWLAYFVPAFRGIFGQRISRHRRKSSFHNHFQSNISIAVLCVCLPIIITAALSNFCLVPNAIQVRTWPWRDFQSHHWKDVANIQTGCWRSTRGAWPAAYVLEMNDGTAIDIEDGLRRKKPSYPELDRALQDVAFSFDSRGVAANCGRYDAKFLKTRP
jgi:membrane protein YqaA with SNARE-associated domain